MSRRRKFDDDDDYTPKGPTQPLVPVTAKPLSNLNGKKSRPKKAKGLSAKTYGKELQAMYCRSLMPLSNEVLCRLERWQLKIIAALFKDHGLEMNTWTREQLIPFIQGRQHETKNYRPMKLLKGVWVPELETQEFKDLFGRQSPLDPSRVYAKAWP